MANKSVLEQGKKRKGDLAAQAGNLEERVRAFTVFAKQIQPMSKLG